MGVFKDLKGKVFNRLTVIEISHRSNKKIFWRCRCSCDKEMFADGSKIKTGHTQSCGCLQQERTGKSAYRHGLRKSRFYGIWKSMLSRCENPDNINYHNYGGRGIKVCSEWKDINIFHEWCYNSDFKEGLTLDRKDVNGNYEPDNCRWASHIEQCNNMRKTIYLYIDGVQHTVSDIHRIYGMSKTCIHKYSKQFENFKDAIKQWNINKLLIKNQWNTAHTSTKKKL